LICTYNNYGLRTKKEIGTFTLKWKKEVEKELDNYPVLCKKCGNHLFVFIRNDPYKGRLTDFTIICKECGSQYTTIAEIAKELEGGKDLGDSKQ